MQTYAKPRYVAGTDSVPAMCLNTGEHTNLDLHDWVKCDQPELLNDQEFNMIIYQADQSCYLVKSIDYEFASENDHVIKYRKEINDYLFNCCGNGTTPNWSMFGSLELHPVNSNTHDDGSTFCQAIMDERELGKTDFYTLYGRLADPQEPLAEAITDITDRREALCVAKQLATKYGLPLSAPLFDLDNDSHADNIKVFDVQVQATVTKTISVIAESDDEMGAIHKAHE